MFSTNVRGGKAFAVEQKIRETKKKNIQAKGDRKKDKENEKKTESNNKKSS